FVLTAPQAAATLAVTLIGFEIGLFGTSLVNAVLVLILVSIVLSALLAQRVVGWVPVRAVQKRALGAHVLVVTPSTGPSDAAVRDAPPAAPGPARPRCGGAAGRSGCRWRRRRGARARRPPCAGAGGLSRDDERARGLRGLEQLADRRDVLAVAPQDQIRDESR